MFNFFSKKNIEPDTIKNIYTKLAEIEGRISLLEASYKKFNDHIKGERLNEYKEEAGEKNKELETELLSVISEYQSGAKIQDLLVKHPSLIKIFSKFLLK